MELKRMYWRLWNAPYSSHAGGDHYTRTHYALVTDSGYQVARTTLCGERHGDQGHIADGPPQASDCKRCRKSADKLGLLAPPTITR